MNIILLGDIAFTGIISEQPEKNRYRYKEVYPILNSADLVFANLEVPVKVGESRNEHKPFIHYSLPGPTRELLQLLNIGCVSLANNHIYDCKMPGLQATIGILDSLGIYHTGAGWLPKHLDPVIIDRNGFRIGFLAYVAKSTNSKTEYFPQVLVNYFELKNVLNGISALKPIVDIIIVSLHWGIDYSYYPTEMQVTVARSLVNVGADIIMGHHSHTLQPYERYSGVNIFYSLGGLTFGDYQKEGKTNLQALFRKTKKSAIVSYELGTSNITFIPTKELQGNFVRIDHRNYKKWSRRRWRLYRIKNTSRFMVWLFDFYEKVFYRVFEYFFGYYQNPLRRLIQLRNLGKLRRLFVGLGSD